MKVSVLMPSYNYARYLSESIESVLAQTHSDLELIITDDCSTDSSREIAESWSRRDNRVIPVLHKVNGGLAVARNSALAVSTGSFIALCDADDIWLPEKLAVQLQSFENRPEVGLAHSDTIIIDSDGRPTGQRFSQMIHKKNQKTSGDLFEELCERNFLCVPTVMFRREALEYAGGFDSSLRSLEDWVCFTKIARKYQFQYSAEPLAQYRIHGASLSRNSKGMAQNRIVALRLLMNAFPEIRPQLKAKMFYTLGSNYLETGDFRAALSAFSGSVRMDMAQFRSWARCFQSLVKLALSRN
jgi:glycosyltransferase involved in cell wall biosynthesis